MIGITLIVLQEAIDRRFGVDQWRCILRAAKLSPTDIGYERSISKDSWLLLRAEIIKFIPKKEIPDLLGGGIFSKFTQLFPVWVNKEQGFGAFLEAFPQRFSFLRQASIGEEVAPHIQFERTELWDIDDDTFHLSASPTGTNAIQLDVVHPEGMCLIIEAFIQHAALHFGVVIEANHDRCQLKGLHSCELQLRWRQG